MCAWPRRLVTELLLSSLTATARGLRLTSRLPTKSCRVTACWPLPEHTMSAKQKGLGRGLDALLDSDDAGAAPIERLATLKLGQLGPGRYQPRTKMDEVSL